jgi:hypothetical protein
VLDRIAPVPFDRRRASVVTRHGGDVDWAVAVAGDLSAADTPAARPHPCAALAAEVRAGGRRLDAVYALRAERDGGLRLLGRSELMDARNAARARGSPDLCTW